MGSRTPMRNPFTRAPPPRAPIAAPSITPKSLRIVTEYVLHMSITCLAGEDIGPLYEEYMQDKRLGAPEKEELTQAYLVLHLRAVQAAAT